MVYCPEKHRMIAIEDCEECSQFEGVSLDSTERDSFLVCRASREQEPMDEDLWGSTDLPTLPEVTIPGPSDRVTVTEVMTKDVLCVDMTMSLETLTALLLENGISGVPVVDEQRRPIGMISKSDLVRQHFDSDMGREMDDFVIQSPETGFEYELGPGFHAERIAKATVGEVMMPIAFTVPERASLARAAGLMAFEGVHRVPVVDARGRVVGILSSLDVLRWLASEAGYRQLDDLAE
jgi:CBS domain-containing protein